MPSEASSTLIAVTFLFVSNEWWHLKPYHWYKDLVVLGAKHLQFPDVYVRSIESIESVEDSDQIRRIQHQRLIERILLYSS